MDARIERSLEAFLEGFGPGRIYRDKIGPAVYILEPSWATAIACHRCHYIALVPSIPAVVRLTHRCGQCRALIPLEPPAEVLSAREGLAVVRGPGRRLS